MAVDYTDPTQTETEDIAVRKQVAVDHTGFPRRIHGPAANDIGKLKPKESVVFHAPPHLGFVLCFENERIFGEARFEVVAGGHLELTVRDDAPKGAFSFRTITAIDVQLEHQSCECENVLKTFGLTSEGGGGHGGGEVGGP